MTRLIFNLHSHPVAIIRLHLIASLDRNLLINLLFEGFLWLREAMQGRLRFSSETPSLAAQPLTRPTIVCLSPMADSFSSYFDAYQFQDGSCLSGLTSGLPSRKSPAEISLRPPLLLFLTSFTSFSFYGSLFRRLYVLDEFKKTYWLFFFAFSCRIFLGLPLGKRFFNKQLQEDCQATPLQKSRDADYPDVVKAIEEDPSTTEITYKNYVQCVESHIGVGKFS